MHPDAEALVNAAAAPPSPAPPPRWQFWRWPALAGLPIPLAILVAAHLGFGLVRFPVGSIQKRLESVHDWHERGVDGWCFRLADAETQRIARWLREQVGAEHLVRCTGDWRGSLQLLAPILFPALLVAEDGPRGWPMDRPVFAARAPWLTAPDGTTPVVVATRSTLRLEYR